MRVRSCRTNCQTERLKRDKHSNNVHYRDIESNHLAEHQTETEICFPSFASIECFYLFVLLAQLYKIVNAHLGCPLLQLLYRSVINSKAQFHLHLHILKTLKGPPTIPGLYLSKQVVSIIIAMSSHESQAEKVHQDRELARQKGIYSFLSAQ